MRVPQLIITLVNDQLVAEIPGNNGARRKLELGDYPSLAIYAELRQQADHIEWEAKIAARNAEEIRRKTRAKLAERQEKNAVCRAHQHIRPKASPSREEGELIKLLGI